MYNMNQNQNPHIDLYQEMTPHSLADSPFNKKYYESPVIRQSDYAGNPIEYMQPIPQQIQYQPNPMTDMRYSQEQYQQIEGQNNMNVLKLNPGKGSRTPMVGQNPQLRGSRGNMSNQVHTPNTVSHVPHYAMMQPMVQQPMMQPQQQMYYEPQFYNYPEPMVNKRYSFKSCLW